MTEIPLTDEEQTNLMTRSKQGLDRLGLKPDRAPEDIIQALREHLDAHRHEIVKLAESDYDAYADFILDLAYVFAVQARRAYDWSCMRLDFNGQDGGVNIVSPDRGVYVSAIRLIKDIVDQASRSNNTQLLFSTLAPDVLALQLRDGRPGAYIGLH